MAKTLIIHDRFQFRGGAERLVLDLAKILEADIATEFWTATTYPKSDVPHNLFVLDSGEPRIMVVRYLRAQWNFWWKTRHLLKTYDTIIFSGNNCLAAALRPLRKKTLLYYCHTPVRYVYDLVNVRRSEETSVIKRIVYYDIGKWFIRGMYRLGLSRMKTIVTNSQNVHDRLLQYCHRKSHVIYPPIHTEKFIWKGQEDYYLSFARLDSLKRVDDIVRAFQKMPDKKLVIASGGDDEQKIRKLAEGYQNISVVGWVDDAQLKELVGKCIANIYVPVNEDFGMTVVEGFAAGKPCIGVDEGGLKETITEGETGVRIPAMYTINDIIAAVCAMTPEVAHTMRARCESEAQRFSLARFACEMKNMIGNALCHPEEDVIPTACPEEFRREGFFRIAVDASRSIESAQKTGVEVVSDELLKRLVMRHSGLDSESVDLQKMNFTFYTPQHISWLPQVSQRIIARRRFWTIIGFSAALLRDKPDALFVPVHTLPFFCPKKTVRIIHDVSFLRHPQAYSLRERSYMKFDLWRAKRICSAVIVPTEAVKRDLVELLGWDVNRIVVTGWGIPNACHSEGASKSTACPEEFRREESSRTPFILFIGRIEEKKNVANIIRAFEVFHKTHEHWNLILAGKPGHGFEAIEPLIKTPDVQYLGYITQDEKADLLRKASALALVSHEEGFAFPMLEAFQAGVPVIASTIPTLVEIAEDAAVFADPHNIQEIAQNMALVADNQELAKELIKKGQEKLKKYSWDAVIQKIIKTLVY